MVRVPAHGEQVLHAPGHAVQRATPPSRAQVRVGKPRLLAGPVLQNGHRAQEGRIVAPHAVQVDVGELLGRDLALADERAEPMRGEKRELTGIGGSRSGPGAEVDLVALEGGSARFHPQFLEEGPGASGVRLEVRRGRLTVAEGRQLRLLGLLKRARHRPSRRATLLSEHDVRADGAGGGSRRGHPQETTTCDPVSSLLRHLDPPSRAPGMALAHDLARASTT